MTDKELRTLDEMLTNLEIWSTWNKTFANEMIGICSKMRNLLADRKTESNSEKPNSSTISKMEQVDKDINVRSNDEPQTCDDCIWSVCNYNKAFEDEPQKIMEKCYSCKWWNYSYGCSNKKGICEFEPLKDEQSGKE